MNKEQLLALIRVLEAEKNKRLHSDTHEGECAEIGRSGGIETAIHKIKLEALKAGVSL
jgi:hypothetical protein